MSLALTTPPGSVNLSKNPVYVKLTSSSYSGLDNYRAVLRVELETTFLSGTYTQVAEIESIPDSGGLNCFDISSILHAELEKNTTFQVPLLESPAAYTSDTQRRFRLKYLEKYGSPQVEQSVTTSSAYRALLGGVDRHYFGLYDFFSNVTEDNSLLTYTPSGKIIARNEPLYLSWLNYTGSTAEPYIAVTRFDVDGDVISPTLLVYDPTSAFDPSSVASWQVGVLPITPSFIGIEAECVKFRVQVHVGAFGLTSGVSQVMDFYISDDPQDQPADLIWFNAFRVPQILRCTGRKRTRLQVERQLSEHIAPWGYDPTTLSVVQHRREFNQLFTYRSGALKPGEVDALQELLIENQLLEYANDGNYYRLRLTENNYDIYENRRSPNFLDFDAVRAFAPGSYMKLRPLSAGEAGGDLWEINSNGFWALNTGGFFELN